MDSLLTVRVARKTDEAQDICSLELASLDGSELPAFSAGSHLDVHLPGGFVRQYSLCNDPGETHRYVLGVLKDPNTRGGSRAVHDAVREGDLLQVGLPRNRFALAEAAQRHLLLAGGIGITPLLCMAERLASIGADFRIHCCARSASRAAFRGRMQASAFAPRVAFHFDDGPQEQQFDLPGTLRSQPPGTHLYVCGPQGFIHAVLEAARAQGWADESLHREFFGAEAEPPSGIAFELLLAKSGQVVSVPRDQTVLQALTCAGVTIPTACEQGLCGTCMTRVLEGVPEHRDQFLTEAEREANEYFLPCCSRSKSPRLVLDL
jgi:vanillate O-demethylase ferredoxin subunit